MDNKIPSSVTHLELSDNFNQSIKELPSSITHLTFGRKFNQSLDKNILQSVTHLTFGNNFNHKINNCIPKSVTHLVFGKNFDKSLIQLSSSVKEITVSKKYYENRKHWIGNHVRVNLLD